MSIFTDKLKIANVKFDDVPYDMGSGGGMKMIDDNFFDMKISGLPKVSKHKDIVKTGNSRGAWEMLGGGTDKKKKGNRMNDYFGTTIQHGFGKTKNQSIDVSAYLTANTKSNNMFNIGNYLGMNSQAKVKGKANNMFNVSNFLGTNKRGKLESDKNSRDMFNIGNYLGMNGQAKIVGKTKSNNMFNVGNFIGMNGQGNTKTKNNFNVNSFFGINKNRYDKLETETVHGKINSFMGSGSNKNVQDILGINYNTEQIGWNRMGMQRGLSLFGDKDNDGTMNVFDCNPYDPRKQALVDSLVGMGRKIIPPATVGTEGGRKLEVFKIPKKEETIDNPKGSTGGVDNATDMGIQAYTTARGKQLEVYGVPKVTKVDERQTILGGEASKEGNVSEKPKAFQFSIRRVASSASSPKIKSKDGLLTRGVNWFEERRFKAAHDKLTKAEAIELEEAAKLPKEHIKKERELARIEERAKIFGLTRRGRKNIPLEFMRRAYGDIGSAYGGVFGQMGPATSAVGIGQSAMKAEDIIGFGGSSGMGVYEAVQRGGSSSGIWEGIGKMPGQRTGTQGIYEGLGRKSTGMGIYQGLGKVPQKLPTTGIEAVYAALGKEPPITNVEDEIYNMAGQQPFRRETQMTEVQQPTYEQEAPEQQYEPQPTYEPRYQQPRQPRQRTQSVQQPGTAPGPGMVWSALSKRWVRYPRGPYDKKQYQYQR